MRRSAYIKVGALAILEIALLSLFSLPIKTHAVKLDMPTGAAQQASSHLADWIVPVLSFSVVAVVCALVLAIFVTPVWLAVRIIHRERRIG